MSNDFGLGFIFVWELICSSYIEDDVYWCWDSSCDFELIGVWRSRMWIALSMMCLLMESHGLRESRKGWLVHMSSYAPMVVEIRDVVFVAQLLLKNSMQRLIREDWKIRSLLSHALISGATNMLVTWSSTVLIQKGKLWATGKIWILFKSLALSLMFSSWKFNRIGLFMALIVLGVGLQVWLCHSWWCACNTGSAYCQGRNNWKTLEVCVIHFLSSWNFLRVLLMFLPKNYFQNEVLDCKLCSTVMPFCFFCGYYRMYKLYRLNIAVMNGEWVRIYLCI